MLSYNHELMKPTGYLQVRISILITNVRNNNLAYLLQMYFKFKCGEGKAFTKDVFMETEASTVRFSSYTNLPRFCSQQARPFCGNLNRIRFSGQRPWEGLVS